MSQTDLFSVQGKVVCVTGASSGLGRAAATLLAEAGAKVIGLARRDGELRAWSEATEGETATLPADLVSQESYKDLADAIAEPFGCPDILTAICSWLFYKPVVHAKTSNKNQDILFRVRGKFYNDINL